MLTTFYPPYHFGGDAIYVQRLAHALADRGDRVTVVHCADSYRVLARGGTGHAHEPHEGVRVVTFTNPVPLLSPAVTYLSGRAGLKERALRRLFERERFDVVHFHNVSLLGASVLGLGSGVKLYSLHDHWLVCPMHVLWKDDREPCVTPSCVRCGVAFRRPPQLWRATGFLERQLARVDRFVAASAFVLEAHRQRGLDLPGSVVPLFVPDPAPPAGNRSPSAPFLFVGRLERIKGVDTLIDAFAAAPELDLVIAGSGTAEPELRRQAARLANVTFAGQLGPTELGRLYRSAAALVVPSVGYESGPLVVVEAFSHGLPVVGRRLGGITEHLERGGGLLYSTNDELVEILRTLAAGEALRSELGARGREVFLERHTVEAHLQALDEIVAEITPVASE